MILTPKEKALEFAIKFCYPSDVIKPNIGSCRMALIAVNEIIEHTHYFFDELSKDGLPNMFGDELDYWESVKYEIKNYETNS